MGCCGCKCCCLLLLAVIVFIAASLGLFASLFPYPSHASCKVDWVFGQSCSEVKTKLIDQMKEWSGDDCTTKQQCLYEAMIQIFTGNPDLCVAGDVMEKGEAGNIDDPDPTAIFLCHRWCHCCSPLSVPNRTFLSLNHKYLGEEGDTIRGLHTTMLLKFVDRFNFTLNQRYDSCHVKAASESLASYAVIDFGANYCNMRNLVIGSHLDENDSQFKENSTNAVCTMYSIAHCNLYT